MKFKTLFTLFATAAMLLPHAVFGQAEAGSISTDVQFSLFEDGSLINRSLTDFEGKVIIIYYYTPW